MVAAQKPRSIERGFVSCLIKSEKFPKFLWQNHRLFLDSKTMSTSKQTNLVQVAAKIIISGWAAFWTYFLGANLIDNSSTVPVSEQTKGYFFIVIGLLLVWGLTIFAWRKQKIGGMVLLAFGVVLVAAYLISPPPNMLIADRMVTAALLGVLPMCSGALLLASTKRRA